MVNLVISLTISIAGVIGFAFLTMGFAFSAFPSGGWISLGGGGGLPAFITFVVCGIATIIWSPAVWFVFRKKYPVSGIPTAIFFLMPLILYGVVTSYYNFTNWRIQTKIDRSQCLQEGFNKESYLDTTIEFTCVDGYYEGYSKSYRSDGTLISERTYSHGRINGTEKKYNPQGTLINEIQYFNGKKNGFEISYNSEGATTSYALNKNGTKTIMYSQSLENSHTNLIDIPHQKTLCKNETSPNHDRYEFTCVNGLVDGMITVYEYKTGLPNIRAELSNGILNGTYEEFKNGNPYRLITYRNGILHGPVVEYFTDGSIAHEGTYAQGKQTGLFKIRDNPTQPFKTIEFHNGKVVRML